MRRVLAALGVLGILVGVNLVAERQLAGVQLDLTAGRLYTLSAGTRSVLRGLRDPITLRLYYSGRLGARLPAYGAYASHVEDLLREYVQAARGKLRLQVIDPQPFSGEEDQARAAGLQAVPVDQAGEAVFFGLAGHNMLDDERQIAFFRPERARFLEYDLTRFVQQLADPARPVVGVLSSLPVDGDPRQAGSAGGRPWAAMAQLRESYDVLDIPAETQAIPLAVRVLMVVAPETLPAPAVYAIDQFVMRGGRLFLFVDPYSDVAETGSDLPQLMRAWGVRFDPGEVVGDPVGAWRVRSSDSDRVQAVAYLPWFNVEGGLGRDDPATAELKKVVVATAGHLSLLPGTGESWVPLLSSSAQAELVPVGEVRDPDPAAILAAYKPGGVEVMAARVRGVLHSAFTGPPALPPGVARAAGLPGFVGVTTGPTEFVVVADTDVLADRFWVQMREFFGRSQAAPFADNGAFVSNVVGTLAGGDALIGLRARGPAARPFTRIEAMQRRAELRFRRTEEGLQAALKATEAKLAALRDGGPAAVITTAQDAAVEALRREVAATRGRLRRVQGDLRRQVAMLEGWVRAADVAGVPVLVVVFAGVLAIVRRRRRA